jgi:GNAT superfamily N-acetyltransferase
MTTARVSIRPMIASEAEPAADLLRRGAFGEFGERHGFLAWAVSHPSLTPFVACVGGELAGTGVASAHGPVGWVGVVFVATAFRGTGVGRRITRTVVETLEAQGCRSIVLIASAMGRPVYEREGFRVFDRQVRVTIAGCRPRPRNAEPRVRRFAAADMDGVIALDRFVTGEDRAAVVRALVEPATTTVAVGPGGEVRGYLARAPWRNGAVIAPDPEDALRLLERRRHATGPTGHAVANLLASNETGRARLRAAGWREELGGVRMLRGEALDWHPDAIWGLMSGALG